MTTEMNSAGFKRYTYEELYDLCKEWPDIDKEKVQVFINGQLFMAYFWPVNPVKRIYSLRYKKAEDEIWRDMSVPHSLWYWLNEYAFVHE